MGKNIVERQVKSENDGRGLYYATDLKASKEANKRRKEKNVPCELTYKKIVSLDENPVVVPSDKPLFFPNLRTTSGYFTITYNPKNSIKRVQGKPFTIGQDLIACRISVSGVRHWHCLCNRIPELKFIERWSYLTDDLFGVAKCHPGISFAFNINWVAYAKMINEKAEKMGIDIDHKPYVCYITNAEKMAERKSKLLMDCKRTKEDIKDVLDELDKEYKNNE